MHPPSRRWQAKASTGDVESSKVLAECTRKLTQAVEELKEKTKAHSALEQASSEKERDFRKAAKAACAALSEYAK